MILRNYDNITVGRKLYTGKFGGNEFTDGNLFVKALTGDSYSPTTFCEPFYRFQYQRNSIYNANGCCIRCGSDNTPVTYDDYKLGSLYSNSQAVPVSSGSVYGEISYDADTNTFTQSYSCNFTAGEDLVIREIGVEQMYSGSGTYYYDKYTCITYREVLETPIEVAAGQFFKITLTWTTGATPNKPEDYSVNVTVE